MSEPKTMQETIDEISKVAEARGDAFITKVMRRNSVSDIQPELWFQASGASARMIADKEIWLTSLIGDGCGVFDLIAFHETEPMRPIGAPLRLNKPGDIRRDPNVDLLKSPDWNGPRTLMHPRTKPKSVQPEMTTIGPNGASAVATGPQIAFTPAIQVTPGQAKREIDTVDMIAQKRTMEALAQLEAERAKVEADKASLNEIRRQLEMRSTVEPLQRQIEELKSAITTARSTPVVESAPKKSLIEEITPLIAAFAPLYLKSKEQDEAKTNLMIQQMKESSERQAQMFRDMFEKTASKNDGLSEVTTRMAEVMGTVGNMVVQMAHQMKTLQEPAPEQSGLVVVAEALSKPLDKIATAFLLREQREQKKPVVSTSALPPKPPESVADVNQQIEAQRQAEEEEEEGSVDPAEIPNLIELGQMITSHTDVKKVVDFFFDKYKEEDLQIAMSKTTPQGDPEALVETLLAEWIKEDSKNRTYVDTLKQAFRDGAIARGFKKEAETAPAEVKT